jgi:hypothetical protein
VRPNSLHVAMAHFLLSKALSACRPPRRRGLFSGISRTPLAILPTRADETALVEHDSRRWSHSATASRRRTALIIAKGPTRRGARERCTLNRRLPVPRTKQLPASFLLKELSLWKEWFEQSNCFQRAHRRKYLTHRWICSYLRLVHRPTTDGSGRIILHRLDEGCQDGSLDSIRRHAWHSFRVSTGAPSAICHPPVLPAGMP